MSRMKEIMNLSQSYHGTKGSPERQQEDGSIGNLATPCLTEESASHHVCILIEI